MLSFVILGESSQVSDEQFATLVDVAVRIVRDASKLDGARTVEFRIGGLHASEPTVGLLPVAVEDTTDLDADVDVVIQRILAAASALEDDGDELPDWMTATTTEALHQAAKRFDTGPISGLRFRSDDAPSATFTRSTYWTLDRILTASTDTIGSVTGKLETVSITRGAHLQVRDRRWGNSVRVNLTQEKLRSVDGWVGRTVIAHGRLRRDYQGRPDTITATEVRLARTVDPVSIDDVVGIFDGPDSVTWLRDQRA